MQRWRAAVTACVATAAAIVATAVPRHVAGERHIAAALEHICAIQATELVACMGNPTNTGKLNPPAGVAFHAVTVGDDFSCGLATVSSSLRCWGELPGGKAQLPPASTFFVDAHAGPRHVCGLVPNGTVLCFGDASSRGAINVPRGVTFQGVTSGTNYTCGVARNHSVVCWGDATNPVVAAAMTWRAITDAEHVAAGADHACYVRVNGSVACWGSNSRGAAAPPAALTSNGSVWWLAAGPGMTCAILGAGVPGLVTCWGAVTGNITDAGYEVACAGWGCIASAYSFTSLPVGSSSGRAIVTAAASGLPPPRIVENSTEVIVTTVAGNGYSGYADGVGTISQFSGPYGLSLDGAGGQYVGDLDAIRRMDVVTRVVTTVAGTAGSSGRTMGATPLQSKFSYLNSVEADGAGNVYVATFKTTPYECCRERGWRAARVVNMDTRMLPPAPTPCLISRLRCVQM